MRRPRKLALVGAGAAGVLAIGLSVPAFAASNDSPSPSPSTSTSSSAPADKSTDSAKPDRAQAMKDRQEKLAAALAKELGIDQQKVSDALTKVQKDLAGDAKTQRADQLKKRLDQAVKDGKLTQAQEDAIIAAASKGVLPGGGAWGGGNWGGGGHWRGGPGGHDSK
ncbi:hypothetical protein DFJ67_7739 [Asanoa ferruginea]|uniref:Uncharacterized protein n=1 Tax=Asanoa ferruginea TaxID=53367 RepID=A0A3D9ZZT2_9ACTN|nr:hypothetical protein [Asanoa ferruginea]REG01654.1 hypothetical protein DFJ67_7739 [Asanoa ferruginea]GIF51664.1 hypothetical protein Afe04nite_62030 [Asanoa ferruginea]